MTTSWRGTRHGHPCEIRRVAGLPAPVLDPAEVTSTSYVCNGSQGQAGADGRNGLNSLIAVVPEPARAVCTHSGSRVSSGLDLDANGVLDPAEATATFTVCSAAPIGTPPPASSSFTVGGVLSGVSLSELRLTNNDGDELVLAAGGRFTFATALANGAPYNVKVSQQPSTPPQTCAVSNGTGTIASGNVTEVDIVCSALSFTVLGITDTGPGQQPTLTFQAKDNGVARNLQTHPVSSLRATIAGPTTDYARFWQATVQGSGAIGPLIAVDAANGIFSYTLPPAAAIPVDAAGSFAIGLESSASVSSERVPGLTLPFFFAVTDASPVPRRTIVEDSKCDACHGGLTAHGASRRGVQYCATCHNPMLSNDQRVARFEGSSVLSQSMNLQVLIHKIHRGTALTQQPYIIGSNPAPTVTNPGGTPRNYGTVSYPGDLRACEACHRPGTYGMPLPAGVLASTERTFTCTEEPAADTDSYCTAPAWSLTSILKTPPITAACNSCHDATYTAAHALVVTTAAGVESCPTCHAVGKSHGTDLVHRVPAVR